MKKRDKNDEERAFAPLKPADDSILEDTIELSLDDSERLIENIISERLEK